MLVKEALLLAKEMLRDVPDRDVDASWILCAVCSLRRSELAMRGDVPLTKAQENRLLSILERRAKREPLQYIFGTVPFLNIELKTDARALIPRDETALLVEMAIDTIQRKHYHAVLDLCTGSGAIALAVKHNLPGVTVTGSDVSPAALALAGENAALLHGEILLVESDLFSAFQNVQFDCILSNPPYVPSPELDRLERELSFEPQLALDGGCDGLDFYRDIASQAPAHLTKGGLLALEVGMGQAGAVSLLLTQAGFTEINIKKDYSGIDRIVYGVLV